MFTIEVRAGRLIEARVHSLVSRERAVAYAEALGRAARSASGERMILCADHRPVLIYPQPVADKLSELFLRMNNHLERVAILGAKSNATLWMQLGRIVREANNPSRQIFDDRAAAEAHLAPVLDERERARLSLFLAGG
jgi:hypothetical protein